jgi:predicted signal transduction protein with EAL and GGDEF domain/ActR/RegA family two-component response regulator
MMADRLQQCLRSGDTVGRLGGDEFAIVLSNLARADDANVVAQEVVDALARPFDIDGRQIRVTGSVGIAVYPADGEDPEVLLNRSDAAMYLAKQQGRNSFHFYTEELNARVTRRMELEAELRHAVENNEFVLHYQPQISLDTGRIIGVEALIRWNHPQRGLLAPAEFIGAAEESGLIVPIGRWVVDTACAQVAQWHRRGHRALFVAINVSPLEIRRGNVIENVRHALATSTLEPRYLEIELTETLIMDGADSFIRSLNALKDIGITIAIDDFGTGYSSLSYLKRFPVDKVKIDRIFIRDIVTETDDAAIVQAIIAMSHHLQLRVTAEGVETEEQASFLRRCQCDIVQGYLFGAPIPAEQLGALLDSRGSVPLLQEPRGSARSLLIVDDEENNLRALQRVLRRDGYEIHTATSAQQALEVLAHTSISVIVSDQRMPGMSGTELLTRAKMLYPETVRIILSGFTDLGTITAAINEGAIYKFLTKPWEDDVLRDDIRGAFRLHEHQRSNRGAPALESGS